MNEMKGTIIELFDSSNGIILGEDKNNYFFSKMNFLCNFEVVKDKKVLFKPIVKFVNDEAIYIAIRISEE